LPCFSGCTVTRLFGAAEAGTAAEGDDAGIPATTLAGRLNTLRASTAETSSSAPTSAADVAELAGAPSAGADDAELAGADNAELAGADGAELAGADDAELAGAELAGADDAELAGAEDAELDAATPLLPPSETSETGLEVALGSPGTSRRGASSLPLSGEILRPPSDSALDPAASSTGRASSPSIPIERTLFPSGCPDEGVSRSRESGALRSPDFPDEPASHTAGCALFPSADSNGRACAAIGSLATPAGWSLRDADVGLTCLLTSSGLHSKSRRAFTVVS